MPCCLLQTAQKQPLISSERGTQADQPQNQHTLMEHTPHGRCNLHTSRQWDSLNLLTQSPHRIEREMILLYSSYLSELKLEAVTMTSSLL